MKIRLGKTSLNEISLKFLITCQINYMLGLGLGAVFIILSSSICISGFSSNMIAFGDKKGISLTLDKSSYAPLTNIHGNQLSVSVRYEFDDKSPLTEQSYTILYVCI